ncbi:uridine kinase [Anaeramoeba flamelloides]|uniref:Uridine kinase n=1 Tax=Anaeramoeba flamelloides TaxID=1746091 RepID=A0AAV7Z750_9EUKA|nr:uridine kinase [Anaeramoeba flamelloides]KAJ6233564.1 uridine kinase [Anaeramoeba flamelloides]
MTSLPEHSIFDFSDESFFTTKNDQNYLIGVCGGSGSGKTSVCKEIVRRMSNKQVSIVSQDWFYRPLTKKDKENIEEYNFDDPKALDNKLLLQTLKNLKAGSSVFCPDYDFVTHSRTKKKQLISGEVILFEGIMAFHSKELRDLMDMKVFVDVDSDVRLARRIVRDTKERGRTIESVIEQYFKFVKPGYDDFVAPMRKYADVILLRGSTNKVGIDLLYQRIKSEIDNRSNIDLKFNTKPNRLNYPSFETFLENLNKKK